MAQLSDKEQSPPLPRRRYGPPLAAVAATMLALIAWLVFILLYALDWSKGYDLFQNLVVTIVSLVITALVIGLMWVVWGFRRFGGFGDWSDWGPSRDAATSEPVRPAPTR